jgi:thiol-disulfide isomerase/thioredoxin
VASAPAPSDAQPAATPAPSAPAAAALSPAGVKGIRKEIAAGKGAPLLVNFWATWCEPCVQELPDLGTIESRYAAKHVHVLGVSLDLMMEDDSPEVRRSVSKTLAEAGARYPNLLYNGRGDPLIEAFDLPGPIPHSILFGADGRELHRWTGRLSMADLERVLSKL